jgi:hypothetical protein
MFVDELTDLGDVHDLTPSGKFNLINRRIDRIRVCTTLKSHRLSA